MNLRNRRARIIVLISGLVVPAVLLGAFCLAQGDKKTETAGKTYKNIKVLKDLPADQLIPVMHKINDSLGVKCDFCHIVNTDSAGKHVGFELDTKPEKKKAREMMVMVNDIKKHQKTLEDKASCFMCHHGSPEPQMAPTATGDAPK